MVMYAHVFFTMLAFRWLKNLVTYCCTYYTQQAGEFEGMMRYDARVEVEKALESKGLLRGKDPHKMRLGVCSRSGDIIEPMITPQW